MNTELLNFSAFVLVIFLVWKVGKLALLTFIKTDHIGLLRFAKITEYFEAAAFAFALFYIAWELN